MSTIGESSLNPKKSFGDCEDVDNISQLPDELLLKVLLFLPTKVAVSTSILSKRWEFLWMWLPKLEYDSIYYSYEDPLSVGLDPEQSKYERENLVNFIYFNLPLHKAPVLECFRLNFSYGPNRIVRAETFSTWVVIAVSRCVRELSLKLINCTNHRLTMIPSSLYTCKSLVILKLIDDIVVHVPRMACLSNLKTLLLRRVIYSDDKSFYRLLSSCPVLEDLVLEQHEFHCLRTLRVIVPSLQRLTLKIRRGDEFDELVIDTPSLKYFEVTDYKERYVTEDDSYSFEFKDMPNLEEAYIDSTNPDVEKFVRSITFVKRVSLCIRVNAEEAVYREGLAFNQLKHLKLCPCDPNWSKLLVRLLKNSPNLKELEVYINDDHKESNLDPLLRWDNELNSVPECLLSSLETFKWTGIQGSRKVIDLAKYILRTARCLKAATIRLRSALETEDEREMVIQELLLSLRHSTTHTTLMFSFI